MAALGFAEQAHDVGSLAVAARRLELLDGLQELPLAQVRAPQLHGAAHGPVAGLSLDLAEALVGPVVLAVPGDAQGLLEPAVVERALGRRHEFIHGPRQRLVRLAHQLGRAAAGRHLAVRVVGRGVVALRHVAVPHRLVIHPGAPGERGHAGERPHQPTKHRDPPGEERRRQRGAPVRRGL